MLTDVLLAASTVDAYTLTADRVTATTADLAALAGVVVGALAVARPGRRGARQMSTAALIAGPIAAVVGVVLLITADGGPGTGNGVVGAALSVILGLVAVVLGGAARTRLRNT